MTIDCKKCSFANATGSIFCESCGEKLSNSAVEQGDEQNKWARPEAGNSKDSSKGEKIVCLSCENSNPSDSNFCEECGSKLSGPEMPARLINKGEGQVIHIMKENNIFGRQDFVKWVPAEYDDPRISREHIKINFVEDHYALSLAKPNVNITKLNNSPITGDETYKLKNNDEIDIASGRVILVFEVDGISESKVQDN